MKLFQNTRFISSVKVGPKGQITIPVQARNLFQIREGDTLMIMGDLQKGIVILTDDAFYAMMGGILPDDGRQN